MGITCLCCWSWPLRTAGHSCTRDGISLILQWKTSSYCPLDSCIWKSISFITVMFAIVSLCRRVWWGNIRWCPLLCEKSDLCQLNPINCLADQVYNHWSIIKNESCMFSKACKVFRVKQMICKVLMFCALSSFSFISWKIGEKEADIKVLHRYALYRLNNLYNAYLQLWIYFIIMHENQNRFFFPMVHIVCTENFL